MYVNHNKLIHQHAPKISPSELSLPRETRRTLAQLRTNKSPILISYLHKVDETHHPSPLCPLCKTHPHTTDHLFNCTLSNNKIVNLSEPNSDQDAVTKHYADSRKPLITIWAQETGPLQCRTVRMVFRKWRLYPAECGYCMPAPGRILRGSLSSVNVANTSALAVVSIVINGRVQSNHITKPSTAFSNTRTYEPPIEVAKNDRINFRTNLDTSNATNNIVSLLIELDL